MKLFYASIYLFLFAVIYQFFSRGKSSRSIKLTIAPTIFLILAYIVNDQYQIIDEKLSSFLSYKLLDSDQFVMSYFMQYVLTWPLHKYLKYEYAAHSLNIALFVFSIYLVIKYINRSRYDTCYWLLILYPAFYHYSLTGLRDPLIVLVSVLVILSSIWHSKKQFIVCSVVVAMLSISIRPEYSLVIAGFIILRLYYGSSRYGKLGLVVFGLGGLYTILLYLPLAFGVSASGGVLDNIESMSRFGESRYDRSLGADYGSGSHILGGTLYNIPFLLRYPIQVVASFIAPLPNEIRGGLDMVAFAESLMFSAVAGFAYFRQRKSNFIAKYLFVCGIMYMMLQALFAANYGNVLRVRYPCYLFFIASLCQSRDYMVYKKIMLRR